MSPNACNFTAFQHRWACLPLFCLWLTKCTPLGACIMSHQGLNPGRRLVSVFARFWPRARAVALLRVDPTQSSETGKGSREGKIGRGGRGKTHGGEKLMGTAAYGGKGSKGRAANGDWPIGAISCRINTPLPRERGMRHRAVSGL